MDAAYAELVEDEKLRSLMLGKILGKEVWPNNISPKCSGDFAGETSEVLENSPGP